MLKEDLSPLRNEPPGQISGPFPHSTHSQSLGFLLNIKESLVEKSIGVEIGGWVRLGIG